jgi:chemotaxis protein methyltransferase CheR
VTRRFFGSGAGEPVLRADEYRLLRDLVSERLGIWFAPEARVSLERRLRERLVVRGLSSFADYYQLLKYGPTAAEEWEDAAEVLTTHETYFFREDYQLRAFRDELLPMFAKQAVRSKRLRVWSAGCSTGEEAYTIAILALESGLFRPADGWEVRVYGSDLSKKCIAAARRGVYSGASFRSTSEVAKRAWFVAGSSAEPDAYGVSPEVRALCQFGQMNLLDGERTQLVGPCDAIFCRNVLLYFDGGSRRRVIEMFYERLVPGGVLLLGHAESLLNVSTAFELLHLREDLVYRKPIAATDCGGVKP